MGLDLGGALIRVDCWLMASGFDVFVDFTFRLCFSLLATLLLHLSLSDVMSSEELTWPPFINASRLVARCSILAALRLLLSSVFNTGYLNSYEFDRLSIEELDVVLVTEGFADGVVRAVVVLLIFAYVVPLLLSCRSIE